MIWSISEYILEIIWSISEYILQIIWMISIIFLVSLIVQSWQQWLLPTYTDIFYVRQQNSFFRQLCCFFDKWDLFFAKWGLFFANFFDTFDSVSVYFSLPPNPSYLLSLQLPVGMASELLSQRATMN